VDYKNGSSVFIGNPTIVCQFYLPLKYRVSRALARSLFPYRPDDHQFLQIYFISNPDTQVFTRCNINSREILDSVLLRSLQDMLNTHNRHVKSFETAIERVPSNVTDYKLVIYSKFRMVNIAVVTMLRQRAK